jgi:cation diffusion facilitator CzcD-associated flavoprotein CzcO
MTDLPGHAGVAIVGSGFSGLGAAIRLKQDGIHDFVILERAGDLGGTWRDNTYPGCQCDVPSHLYSFSFAPNPNWSRTFSEQAEIWDYLREVAEKHGLMPHIRYHHEVQDAAWDDDGGVWRIQTSRGALSADVLITGVGGLSDPKLPDIAGIESFEGAAFHSAQWNHDHDVRGEKVAVIGTGASSIQIVPSIQPQVERLLVVQRTAPWIVPTRDRPLTRIERLVYRAFPPAQLAMRALIYWARELFVIAFMRPREGGPNERLARRHLEKQVKDPELRAKLTPNYRMGCKRILLSNDYYPALQRPNAELLTGGIREIRPHSIVDGDGVEHEVDTIIFGTGFHVTDMPVADWVRGRDGRALAEVWEGSPQAYLGTTVAGFPNLFMLTGPNTGLGHNSIVFMIESQLNYVMEAVRFMRSRSLEAVEVREHSQVAYNEELQSNMEGTVWTSGGCASWYIDSKGKNSTLWPGFTWPFRQRTRHFDPAHYVLRSAEREREPVAA